MFNALSSDPEKNELMKAFSILTGQGQISIISSLRAMYPALRFLVCISIVITPFHYLIYIGLQPAPNDAVRSKAAAVMKRIGMGLLKQSKDDNSDVPAPASGQKPGQAGPKKAGPSPARLLA